MNRSLGRRAACFLAMLILLAGACDARAQEKSIPPGQDSHAFRFILNQLELQPLKDLDEAVADSEHTVLIVFGQTAMLDEMPQGLKEFVEGGGAVMIATDRSTTAVVRKAFGAWVREKFLKVDPQRVETYRALEDCPFLTATPVKDPPLFEGLTRIATNKPSYLEPEPDGLPILARVPANYKFRGFRGVTLHPFAAGGAVGDGRVLILADHSIFINDMMLQADNDNFDFAYGCVEWLTGPENQRTKVLFLNDGQAVTNFDVPLKAVPDLPMPPVEVLEKLLFNLEKEDVFNHLLRSINPYVFRHVSVNKVLAAAAVLLTLALLTLGIFRFTQARHRWDGQGPQVPDGLAAPGAAAVVDQRHQTMLRDNNLWEAARHLARKCFTAIGYDPAALVRRPAGKHPLPDAGVPAPPRIIIHTQGWHGRALRNLVSRLWGLAYGPRPRRITGKEFTRLRAQVEDLKLAVREGRLHLAGPGDQA